MSKLVYGNALAVHDPDPRTLDAIERRLSDKWNVTRPLDGWLLAVAEINDLADARTAEWPGGGTLVFVEDSTGRCDGGAVTGHRVNPEGDVTAIGVHAGGVRVVRSCAGMVPVYIARHGRRVAVATLIAPLVDAVLDRIEIDPLGLAAWLTGFGFFPDDRTWIEGVTVVPPGHAADVARNGTTTAHRYWDPRPQRLARPTEASRAEHVAALREAVLSSLDRTLDPRGRNLLTLSGGADSTLLAYLIAGRFGLGLSTLSFRSNAPGEARIEDKVIGAFAAAHPPRNRWRFDSTMSERIARIQAAPPVPVPLLHPALQLLPPLMAQTPIAVYVGGEFADHVAGGAHHESDWFERTSPAALLAAGVRGRLPAGGRDLPRWVKRRVVRRSRPPRTIAAAPAFLAPAIREGFGDWAARRDQRLSGDTRPWRHFAARMEVEEGVTAMNWEACSAAGVLRAMPFCSRATIENVYACDASELIGPGVKRLIRAAFDGDAPDAVLSRVKYRGDDAIHDPIQVRPTDAALGLLDPTRSGPYDGVEGLMVAVLNRLTGALGSRIADKTA